MNFSDEFDNHSPLSASGMHREPKVVQHEEIVEHRIDSQNGFDEPQSIKKVQATQKQNMTAFYKQYFQVNETEVIQRVTTSVTIPYNSQFIDQIRPNPDFYGPLWIFTTLIFLLGSVGNLSNYLLSKFSQGQVWQQYFFKLQYVRQALAIVYTFGFGVPASLYFFFRFISDKIKLQLPQLICLYGYAYVCFLPAVAICILPVNMIHWLAMLYACANSSLFLIANLKKHVEGIDPTIMYSVIGVTQFIFMLILKWAFLSLIQPTQTPVQ